MNRWQLPALPAAVAAAPSFDKLRMKSFQGATKVYQTRTGLVPAPEDYSMSVGVAAANKLDAAKVKADADAIRKRL